MACMFASGSRQSEETLHLQLRVEHLVVLPASDAAPWTSARTPLSCCWQGTDSLRAQLEIQRHNKAGSEAILHGAQLRSTAVVQRYICDCTPSPFAAVLSHFLLLHL
eukprot:GHUV01031124.1.p4 GENE.GHUV01031124.1~~GHUV01031124.1.p4  ORF type:complete len:107 (-),score=32.35 GHUV01031124.1:123-443(-)